MQPPSRFQHKDCIDVWVEVKIGSIYLIISMETVQVITAWDNDELRHLINDSEMTSIPKSIKFLHRVDYFPHKTMTITSGSRYFITNKKAGTVVDLDTRNYRTVHAWTRHGGANQQVKTSFSNLCNLLRIVILLRSGSSTWSMEGGKSRTLPMVNTWPSKATHKMVRELFATISLSFGTSGLTTRISRPRGMKCLDQLYWHCSTFVLGFASPTPSRILISQIMEMLLLVLMSNCGAAGTVQIRSGALITASRSLMFTCHSYLKIFSLMLVYESKRLENFVVIYFSSEWNKIL